MTHAHSKRRGGGVSSSTSSAAKTLQSKKHHPPAPPPPFSRVEDTSLSSTQFSSTFLDTLPRSHIYLTSLDKHPSAFKRRLFAVPLILNIFISALILYRIQQAWPTYLDLILAALGHDTPSTINVKASQWMALLGVGAGRMGMFLGDFVLLRFVGMWPWDFFVGRWSGGGSPVGWRRWVYFRDVEIVVRRSRKWDRSLWATAEEKKEKAANANADANAKANANAGGGGGGSGDKGKKKEEEEAAVVITTNDAFVEQGRKGHSFKERVEPAVAEEWVRTKTGYLMMDKSWDLYFSGMVDAQAAVDDGTLSFNDFRNQVLVYSEKYGGWLVWEVWEEHKQEENVRDDGPFSTEKLREAAADERRR